VHPDSVRSSGLDAVLTANDGVLTRATALQHVSHDCLDRAVKSGRIVRVLPTVFVAADQSAERCALERAALEWAGPDAALSHLSALRAYGLPVPDAHGVHVLVSGERRLRRQPGVELHRQSGFHVGAPLTVVRGGRTVVRLEHAVVASWPLLSGDEQRAPAILAVRERLTTAARLLCAAQDVPRVAGAASLLALIGLLAAGCRSELEIWGYRRIFDDPLLRFGGRWQRPMMLSGRRIYLDRSYDEERLVFELDGRKYHSSPAQREADMRRDSRLAVDSWQCVRFSHQRLTDSPDECRAEAVAIRGVRRRLLGLPPAELA
jgi:very-short-patch-repair endonuclease